MYKLLKGQVSKETVVPRLWEYYKIIWFYQLRSDEGLTLETSAPESLYGGQFTLSTQLIKPNYLARIIVLCSPLGIVPRHAKA